MKTIIKWDKKTAINGVVAENILKSNPTFKNAEIYLILNDDRVERIENADTIRKNTGYAGTDEEVMSKYLDVLENPEKGMSRKELIDAICEHINKFVDQQILSGFIWNDMPVWLSAENQMNYKAIYDLAVQDNNEGEEFAPEHFKFGTDENAVYHKFTSYNELRDFYRGSVDYIKSCIAVGWADKEALNDMTDEQLREKYKQMQL